MLAATAIALGTYSGGWRVIRTVGSRIIRMDAAQAFSAQGSGAAVILISSHFGYPLSSTHVISGGVMGPVLIVLVAIGGPVSMTLATRRRRLTEAASA